LRGGGCRRREERGRGGECCERGRAGLRMSLCRRRGVMCSEEGPASLLGSCPRGLWGEGTRRVGAILDEGCFIYVFWRVLTNLWSSSSIVVQISVVSVENSDFGYFQHPQYVINSPHPDTRVPFVVTRSRGKRDRTCSAGN